MRSILFVDPPAFCTTVEGLVAPALRTQTPICVDALATPGVQLAWDAPQSRSTDQTAPS